MNQTQVITFFLFATFFLSLVVRGRLAQYIAVIYEPAPGTPKTGGVLGGIAVPGVL